MMNEGHKEKCLQLLDAVLKHLLTLPEAHYPADLVAQLRQHKRLLDAQMGEGVNDEKRR
jgi:hypothetical protein